MSGLLNAWIVAHELAVSFYPLVPYSGGIALVGCNLPDLWALGAVSPLGVCAELVAMPRCRCVPAQL